MFGKKTVLWVIFSFVICLLVSPAQARLYGGNGTTEDPFIIDTASKMNDIGNNPEDWDKYFLLTADIDLAGYSYNMIGNPTNWFSGVFDGNDHKIRNVTINGTGVKYMGIFACTDPPAEIKDIILISMNIHNTGTYSATGSLVGYNRGLISNCYSTGNNTVSGEESVGGLVGYNNSGVISECRFDADNVTGGGYTGGLLGYNNSGVITGCASHGNVTGAGSIGGLIGMTHNGSISSCYSDADVNQVCPLGCFYAGGLVGKSYNGTITNCWTKGDVFGSTVFGGLVGLNYGGTVSHSNSRGNVIGDNSNDLGAFAGVNQYGTISQCYAMGDASSNGDVVGGFVGLNTNASEIINCYSAGNAEGTDSVGSMVGSSGSDSTIINCYSLGTVSGVTNVGAFIGEGSSEPGLYQYCHWHETVNPTLEGIGNIPGSGGGLSTEMMRTQRPFSYWDFKDVWDISEGQTFPFLREYHTGDLNHDGIVDILDFAWFTEDWLQQ